MSLNVSLKVPRHYPLDSASSIIPALEAWQDWLDGVEEALRLHQHNDADKERAQLAHIVAQTLRLSQKYAWPSLPLWDAAMYAVGLWQGDILPFTGNIAILFEHPIAMIECIQRDDRRTAMISLLVFRGVGDPPLKGDSALSGYETVWFGSGVTPDGLWDNFMAPVPVGVNVEVDTWVRGQWCRALLDFMHSPVILQSPLRELPTNRAERRRLMGVVMPEDVRLVTLRPRKSQATGGDGMPVDWSCQWIVTGHWRNQWCPKAQQHQPRWILPYVKGPADKPLRTPSQRIYTVAR